MNCSICQFPWLWWALSVIVAYLVGWLWYSVFFKNEWAKLESGHCTCGPDCKCGCHEGKECTCGPDCKCGCHEGKECTCGPDCKCECCHHGHSVMPMLVQLGATALVGFVLFWATHVTIWLALGIAIAFSAWAKASIFFRAGWGKRARSLIWIDVSYLFIVCLVFILVAACIGGGCACGAGCGCGAGCCHGAASAAGCCPGC